ncbi:MAG: peptidase C39 family protein, partial [Actinomycetota bacterium]|nr:peptidase C39 family protein [Actinomycetota bacterium]
MRLTLSLAAVLCAMLSAVPAAHPSARASAGAERAAARPIAYTQWDGADQWRAGAFAGTRVQNSRLVLADPADRRRYAGRLYEQGRWDSPWVGPGFALTELVPSWSARTPSDTWIEVRVRAKSAGGQVSSWDVMGRWTSGDRHTRRRTVSGQTDDLGRVNVDTWRSAAPAGMTAYQVRVQLLRRAALRGSPSVDTVGAVASRLPPGRVAASVSAPGPGRGT